jgi:hypothetical protein
MAVRDQVTKMNGYQGNYDVITTDTTTVGATFDTADYELGFSVFLIAPAWTDGTYTLLLEESDDAGMAGAVTVPDVKLIGTFPAVAAATVDGIALGKVGVFSNLRYIRVSIVSTGTSSGATIATTVIKHGEYLPA